MGLVEKWTLEKGDTKVNFAAQDQASSINDIRKNAYGEDVSLLCPLCCVADKIVEHIVVECPKLAQKEHK